ncbi:MAG TPA: TetR/AcrR family transcriptional regulator [Methanobacteriaceae archaeon]|nr:TetR/AcrR family transcriptional regulator [Methanobacteriaceae archaeon]
MTSTTEEKILETALKIFAEKGYVAATTKTISTEAGFSEMTLFRKFGNKESLFEAVLVKYQEKIVKDFGPIMADEDGKTPRDHLKFLINSLVDLMEENFEYVNIIIYERKRVSDSITQTFVAHLGEYLEEHFPREKINHKVLAFNILSFIYFVIFNKKFGSNSFDFEVTVEEFINYNARCLQK